MKKFKIFLILIILFALSKNAYGILIEIKVKIQNQIITNLDIQNEIKYLFFLNPKLQELEISRIESLAKDSLITEIIKKKELEKYFDFDQNKELINNVENQFILKKNIENKDEFIKILKNKDIDYAIVKQKLYVETLWNQLIYQKYSSNIIINKVELKKNIIDQMNKEKKKFSYNLSEIFFSESVELNSKQIVAQINESIEKIGFENTANIYSISNTANTGGLIGWVNELQLSNKINKEIIKLNINGITKPIKLQNGYILIKLNNKREIKQKINVEEQLKRLVNKEINRQLNNFSTIFFKRLKKNMEINEY